MSRNEGLKLLALALALLSVSLVAYGFWQLERRINYRFAYRTLVEETVRDMVKAEALK